MVVKRDPNKRRRRHHHRRVTPCEIPSGEAPPVRMITAATPYGYVEEYLPPFGGIFPLKKLYDALEVESAFAEHFGRCWRLSPRPRNIPYGEPFHLEFIV